MDNIKNYMLPGLYENFEVNKFICELFFSHPEYFYDGVNLRAIYGNFQYCTWDGGRVFQKYTHATIEYIEEIISFFNQNEIPIRLIFTNSKLQKEHCYDRFNNLVLSMCENDINEIVVNSPILKDYIKENYPKYHFVSSTTKCITNQEQVKKELNNPDYTMVCLDYNLNHNKKLLESFTDEEKEHTELLINAICAPGCPVRKHHYELNSLSSLNYGKKFNLIACGIEDNGLSREERMGYTRITPEEINEYYVPNGFHNFKMEGRSYPPLVHLCNLVKYMIKPEYQIYAISLANHLFKEG